MFGKATDTLWKTRDGYLIDKNVFSRLVSYKASLIFQMILCQITPMLFFYKKLKAPLPP